VAGGPLELAAEPLQRGPEVVEALEHDRRPTAGERGDATEVGRVVDDRAADADRVRGGGRRERLTVADEAEARPSAG
jgi:hypothetical protein